MSWSLRSWEVFQWLCHVHIVEFCPFLIRQVELYNSFVCSHRHVSVSMHMCMSMWSRACLCGHVYAYAVMCMSMRSCACVCGHVMSMWSRACLWGHVHVYGGGTHMPMSTSTCWEGTLERHSSETAHLFVFWDKVSSWPRTYLVG